MELEVFIRTYEEGILQITSNSQDLNEIIELLEEALDNMKNNLDSAVTFVLGDEEANH